MPAMLCRGALRSWLTAAEEILFFGDLAERWRLAVSSCPVRSWILSSRSLLASARPLAASWGVGFFEGFLLAFDAEDHFVEGAGQGSDGVGAVNGDLCGPIAGGQALRGGGELADGQEDAMHQGIGQGQADDDQHATDAHDHVVDLAEQRRFAGLGNAHRHVTRQVRSPFRRGQGDSFGALTVRRPGGARATSLLTTSTGDITTT